MSYQLDPANGDIIIGGFDKGIADSPYSGITDMRSVDPTTIPGEVSVSMKSSPVFNAARISFESGTLNTTDGGSFFCLASFLLEDNQTITFSDIGTAVGAGLAIDTPYVVVHTGTSGSSEKYQLYTQENVLVTISVAGTVVFSTVNPQLINYIVYDGNLYYAMDNDGFIWTSGILTAQAGNVPATNSWAWIKNPITNASGNGMTVFITPSSGTVAGDAWLFAFRDQAIDYAQVYNGSVIPSPTWFAGWNPNTGTTGATTQMQNTIYHQAIVAPDGNMYFINSSSDNVKSGSIGKVQANWNTPGYTVFNPASAPSLTNYTYADFPIIPKGSAPNAVTCLTPSGTNLLIAGQKNFIYNWDTISRAVSNYIYVAETNIVAMVTANQNTYVFAGNRGNIYITNGSQAQVWKKIPDYLSGTVYPFWEFHGATYQKGRLYFGLTGSTQTGVTINTGGIWCVDLASEALWCAGQLSYGTYLGYATAFLNTREDINTPTGTQLYVGWYNGSTKSGVDYSISTPFTSGQSYVVSDVIPVGTLLKPTTPLQFEYKLAAPLLTGETVALQTAKYVGGTFTNLGTTSGSTGGSILSDIFTANDQQYQWLLVKAILSCSSNTSAVPSYNRLTQIRIISEKPFGLK